MRKLAYAINIVAAVGLAGGSYLWTSKVKAQCNGIFPPNTLCGNLSATSKPPAAFSATTSVIGPGSSTINDLATWANTTGNQLKDAGGTIIGGNYAFSGTMSFTGTVPANITAGTSGTMIMTGGIGQQQAGSSITNLNSDFAYNVFRINNDNTNVGAGPGNSEYGIFIENDVGGTNVQGQRYALRGVSNIGNTGTLPSGGTHGDNVGLSGWGISALTNGGTTSQFNGTLYGLEGVGHAFSGATSYSVVSGGETEGIIDTGATAKHRWGWSIVSNTTVRGSTTDANLEMGSTGVGAATGILLDNVHGAAPLASWGCMICTDGSSNTISEFVDLTGYTIAANIFNFPNWGVTNTGMILNTNASGGLNTSGNISGATIAATTTMSAPTINATTTVNTSTYKVNGTFGVSCAAGTTSAATLTIVGGIVTHC